MNRLTYLTAKPLHVALAGALAFAVPAALVVPQAAVAQSSKQELDQVIAALRGIGTMTADFTQSDRNGRTVRGKLTLKRPGKIRFEYEKGVNMLLVSDGKSLTFLDYDVNQKQRYPIGNSPLGALLDPSRDVKKYGRIVWCVAGSMRILPSRSLISSPSSAWITSCSFGDFALSKPASSMRVIE